MQASNLQTSATDLLSQLFGGMLGDGASLESLDGMSFLGAFGDQLKDLLVKQGEDPGEIAAMDGQALVAQFLMMMQAQAPTADLKVGAMPLGDSKISGAGNQPDALALLRQLMSNAVGDPSEGASDIGDTAAEDRTAFVKAIPSDLLDRLMTSSSLEELAAMTAKSSGAVADASAASGAAPSFDFSMMSLSSELAADAAEATLADLRQADDVPVDEANVLSDDIGSSQSDGSQSSEDAGLALLGAGHGSSSLASAAAAGQKYQVFDLATLLQAGGEKKLVDQVRWVIDGNAGSAELKLHPASLGELDVRVSTDADRTNIQFISPHPIAREVLEAALPRLRDALAQDGVNLGSVTVSDQAPQDPGSSGKEQGHAARYGQEQEIETALGLEEVIPADSTLSILARRHDYFA